MTKRGIRLPKNLIYRFREIVPAHKIESVLHAFTVKRPTTIRANTLKISGHELRRALLEAEVKPDTVFWYRDAFIIRNKTLKYIRTLKHYIEGDLYVQSLASMIPPLILNPKPGEKILDMAAAPGSKTTQMAAIMENKGEIVANDPNPIRAQKLNANLLLQGAENVKIILERGERLFKTYPDYFDKVLLDTPCSGEGRINTFDWESYKYWSYKHLLEYSALQKKLLTSALLCVKKGGSVVYSTCSISPEENEEVVSSVLEKAGGLVTTENIHLHNFPFERPIMKYKGQEYHRDVSRSARIYPSGLMEGFFIAVLKRR